MSKPEIGQDASSATAGIAKPLRRGDEVTPSLKREGDKQMAY
jgi:hypothetical protein